MDVMRTDHSAVNGVEWYAQTLNDSLQTQCAVLRDFLAVGTIIATRYCDTLPKLKETIQKKRNGLIRSGVLMLEDNARPYSATVMQNHIATLGWESQHHPSYSPDLAPSDFLCLWF
ncbi:histone-lysine N-methyltransferase SETMAR [Trichonephila clavipes]|nr:histone-lysine N-methyltransferase SETMAR [Trichonephila clavipes]